MVRYECRKLLQKRATRIILLILFVVNAFLVWNQQVPGTQKYLTLDASHILTLYGALPENPEEARNVLEQQVDVLQNGIMAETDTAPRLTTDVYTELKLFGNVIDRVTPIAEYDSILCQIEENAEVLLRSGRFDPSSFGYRNIVKSEEVYQRLQDVEPEMLYSGGIELLPGGRITDFILLIFCILLGLESICTDYVRGTMALTKPTTRGRYPAITAKILTGLWMASLGVCIFYGTNLLIGFVRCGTIPLDVPIQSIHGFIRSPWKISIMMYILGFLFMKFLWASAIIAIVYLACCLGKNILSSCGLFILFCIPSLLGHKSVVSLLSTGDTVKFFSEYRNLNVFGWPVSSFFISILVLVILSAAGFGIATRVYMYSSPLVSTRKRRKQGKWKRIPTGLMVHEARKLLLTNGAIWVLVGLLAVQMVSYLGFDAYIGPEERMYMQYSEKLSGSPDHEKDAFVEEEAARFADLYAQMEAYSLAYARGELSYEAYTALNSGLQRQAEAEMAFQRARDQYEQMKSRGCDYVCQTGYQRLLGPEGLEDVLILSMRLLLGFILGLSSIHSLESETNMALILDTVPGKRDSRKAKRILITGYAMAAAMMTFVPHVLAIVKTYGLSGLLADSNSVPLLKTGAQTVLGGLCIYAAFLIGLSVLTAHVIGWISKKAGSIISAVITSSVLLLIPAGLLLVQ